jgi:hypothetical protein
MGNSTIKIVIKILFTMTNTSFLRMPYRGT